MSEAPRHLARIVVLQTIYATEHSEQELDDAFDSITCLFSRPVIGAWDLFGPWARSFMPVFNPPQYFSSEFFV